jgi:hypothetical protein
MEIPAPLLATLIGLLIVGALVTGLVTICGFALTLIIIWKNIAPKTEGFARENDVREIELRLHRQIEDTASASNARASESRAAIAENRSNTDAKFLQVFEKIEHLGEKISNLSQTIAAAVAAWQAHVPNGHGSRRRRS